MKSFINLASVLASVVALAVADDACERDGSVLDLVSNTVVTDATSTKASAAASTVIANVTNVFSPTANPTIDRHDLAHVLPNSNVSLYYASNLTVDANMKVNHTMKYGTVVLEQIAAVTNVTCTSSSVAVTFNDSSVFDITQASWSAEGNFVLITNHRGECDPELERSFFLVRSISFDNTTLIATASAAKTNISATAAGTEISFGNIPTSTIGKRGLTTTLDPSYTIATTLALASDTSIFSYSPYLYVTADTASFTGNVTLSGYLKYNWLTIQIEDLYLNIDAGFSADLALTVEATASYSTTFSYAPTALFYGVSVPGILELGPQLQFGVDAYVYAGAEVTVTTELTAGIVNGNVHLDLLDSTANTQSGWVPTYSAKINVTGGVEAELNPAATLTVEVAIDFFGGLLDLSTGLTAAAGFNNSLILTGAAGFDFSGIEGLNKNGTCDEGLALISDFIFSLKGFATEWLTATLYSVDVPLLDKCFSWE